MTGWLILTRSSSSVGSSRRITPKTSVSRLTTSPLLVSVCLQRIFVSSWRKPAPRCSRSRKVQRCRRALRHPPRPTQIQTRIQARLHRHLDRATRVAFVTLRAYESPPVSLLRVCTGWPAVRWEQATAKSLLALRIEWFSYLLFVFAYSFLWIRESCAQAAVLHRWRNLHAVPGPVQCVGGIRIFC